MNFKLISCEVFKRELLDCIYKTKNSIDAEFIAKGIHDLHREGMQKRIVKSIQQADEKGFDAILLGYGLCNTWIYGLSAKKTPLVIPRSHDCIGILMGSKRKYLDYFFNNPGTYFQSVGWMENTENDESIKKKSLQRLYGMDIPKDELIANYGEKNAQYLIDAMVQTKHYSNIVFIETGIDPKGLYSKRVQEKAINKRWSFDKVTGSKKLLQKLINGNWPNSEFLYIQPGSVVQQSIDDDLIHAVPGPASV
jgi:hypothetical protein|tara:strand:- start:1104 stop:1856 length:753 start_codon:yes stop_codon:yes gene_type:complete